MYTINPPFLLGYFLQQKHALVFMDRLIFIVIILIVLILLLTNLLFKKEKFTSSNCLDIISAYSSIPFHLCGLLHGVLDVSFSLLSQLYYYFIYNGLTVSILEEKIANVYPTMLK